MSDKNLPVSFEDYYKDMQNLISKLDFDFDCIVALKRSGWILGAFLSNQLSKPIFTDSEIKSIPAKFSRILIVDDKIHKGKSIQRVKNKLKNRVLISACLYVEGNVFPDYFVKSLNKIIKMWYESRII